MSFGLSWRVVALFLLTPALTNANPYVVLDTGHMPSRPGAMGATGQVEYQYNLNMSTAVAHQLEQTGVRVLRIAADGNDIELKDRSTQAPDADVFVSIHHDSMPQEWIDEGRNKTLSGFSIFVSKKNPQFDKSLACAQNIGAQLLSIKETPSLYHASEKAGQSRPFLDEQLGVHQFDDLVVLKTAPIPAVLVEIGVIVNPSEAVRLSHKRTIKTISHAIAQGIQTCIQNANNPQTASLNTQSSPH
ncbi:N-acetylmuramoyl-L-alanine amidase family protein [Hydromonas duriensis]|nr:N-acetylmuramoyl-L-alanine amidase [Hydromonas duriensis]